MTLEIFYHTFSHEMLHGFGRAFFKCGPGEAAFDNMTRCMLRQYGADQEIHAKRTLEENVADHGAIKLIYNAYGNVKALKNFLDS